VPLISILQFVFSFFIVCFIYCQQALFALQWKMRRKNRRIIFKALKVPVLAPFSGKNCTPNKHDKAEFPQN
jgi:hypothetical protein